MKVLSGGIILEGLKMGRFTSIAIIFKVGGVERLCIEYKKEELRKVSLHYLFLCRFYKNDGFTNLKCSGLQQNGCALLKQIPEDKIKAAPATQKTMMSDETS